jgi:hypothetical protein
MSILGSTFCVGLKKFLNQQKYFLKMSKYMYDLFVIGGGSGGVACARYSNKYNIIDDVPHMVQK